MTGEKIKLIRFITSSTGMGRRQAMELLKNGRVKLDGMPVRDSTIEVDPGRDKVTIDNTKVSAPRPHLYFVMYKPRKTICSREDPEGRPMVFDLLRRGHGRAFSIGRLDYNTTGVLILTTDGMLADGLLRSKKLMRQYVVKLKGAVTDGNFEKWRMGLMLEGRMTSRATVRILERKGNVARVLVTVTEGWYHLIHRIAERTGMRALKIHRSRFGGITLSALKPGTYRILTKKEVDHLRAIARV
ncbi:MAG: pseudouridine synthase [Pseudomonadota bacterium]